MSPSSRKRKRQLERCSSQAKEDKRQLTLCSSLAKVKKKYVLIYFGGAPARVARVSVGSLITSLTPSPRKSYTRTRMLPSSVLDYTCVANSCIVTSVGGKERLYFFGGKRRLPPFPDNNFAVREVYRYDLSKFPESGSMSPCEKMIHEAYHPLLVQVGNDYIYVLGRTTFPRMNDRSLPEFAFQVYNLKKDKWTVLDGLFDINNCGHNPRVLEYRLDFIPHVVIGHKLHVSVGEASFTFDTVKCVWEDCKLFETFWSNTDHTPLDFYGTSVWHRPMGVSVPKKTNNKGGPPFGFSGRGFLWDENILLGVHYAKNCPVVAFLLDDNGNVVKSMKLSLNNLAMDGDFLRSGARLIDLGRDGYFGLLHFVFNKESSVFTYPDYDPLHNMELVIFKVSKKSNRESENGNFLACEVIHKEVVADYCSENHWLYLAAK